MKKTIKIFSIILLTTYCQLSTAFAQGPGLDDEIVDTPIDGGVTLVLAAAAGYGFKKLRDRRK